MVAGCDQTGNVVTMVRTRYLLSDQQLRVPRDATVIGRVTNSCNSRSSRTEAGVLAVHMSESDFSKRLPRFGAYAKIAVCVPWTSTHQ